MEPKDFELITIIAARKAELYKSAKQELLSTLPRYVDRNEAKLRLRRAIASLDNMLFVSDEEKATKTITPGVSVADLKLDESAIVREVARSLVQM